MDINRRLNDLLNAKDEEIVQLNNTILELRMNKYETSTINDILLKSPKPSSRTPNKYAEVHNQISNLQILENKLKESERLNKEQQQEIKAMQRIQLQQSKALESMTNETDFP